MPFRYETWKITCEWQNQTFVSKNCLLSIVSNVRNNSNEIWKTVSQANSYLKIAIRHLHISHKAPYSPAKICFSFLLGITAVPREIENNAYAKFWRQIRCIMGDVQVAYCNRFESSSSFSIRASICICSVVLFIPSFHVWWRFLLNFDRLRDTAPFSFSV